MPHLCFLICDTIRTPILSFLGGLNEAKFRTKHAAQYSAPVSNQ